MDVFVRLLGPVRVVVDGVERGVGGRRQRAVLALLALQPRHAVSVDSLIAGVWGDVPPPSGTKTVRAYVSRLRSVVGDALAAAGRGYVLDVPPGCVDVLAVSAAVVKGRALLEMGGSTEARDLLGGVVDLAAGEPDPDVFGAPGLLPWLPRIAEDQAAAVEVLVEADIACGHASAVLPMLEQLVVEHPYREQLWASLMRALHATGRQADALNAYQRARRVLVEQLGLEPGEQLRQLEQAVLRQDAWVAPGPRAAHLPAYRTSFVGRDDDLDRLRALMRQERMVTVVGPGGVGKTRLVVEALSVEPADGRYFVDLSRLRTDDIEQVTALVAHALSVGLAGRLGPFDLLVAVLRRSVSLLVLDNAEQVAAAVASLVERLLATVPDLRIVVTSRTTLRLDGEVLLRLDPLPVPGLGPSWHPQLLLSQASVALFMDRARAVMPSAALSDETLWAIARLVVRLDGIPLALEMAAARLRSVPLDELAMRLDQHVDELVRPWRAGPERHASLRATIEWSYDLLSPVAQRLLRLVSVFRGGWTLPALEAAFVGPHFVVNEVGALDELVNSSLVELGVQGATGRYRLLDTVRDFAWELLGESDDLDDALSGHARWALALAEANDCDLYSVDVETRRRVLDNERENLLGATDWALEHDPELGPRLAGALGWWWRLHGDSAEASRRLRRALAVERNPTHTRARLLRWLAFLLAHAPGDAASAATEAIEIAETLGADDIRANCLHILGYVHRVQGDFAAARDFVDAALPLWRRLGQSDALALSMGLLADIALDEGNFGLASSSYAEGLELMKQAGSRHGVLAYLHSMADLAALTGRLDDAEALVEEALPMAEDIGDVYHVALLHQVRGQVCQRRGDTSGAAAWLASALERLWRQNELEFVLSTLDILVATAAGSPERAERALLVAEAVDGVRDLSGVPRSLALAPLVVEARASLADLVPNRAEALSLRASAWTTAELVERGLDLARSLASPGRRHLVHDAIAPL